ncbi:DUF423 domain-containing protein [Xanthomonas citri pv. malvacearum]|uniref:DUF423 domain-containing protein n=1 Tax=Xanthomonas campestris pv. malvacearum TaxID=86040 RepID=A0AA44Z0D8_XANCM|nr:DUF423 domain-containing protein [Xanthomonas citri]OOW62884.1 hypothetical protein Xths_14040 [Xanthomonas campestris pv. thespesiae]OOW78196.1 hypothetical protein Xlen_01640 [Xanthomonas campestris pv. leeana]AOL20376.1 hypothetical protein BGK55_15375 [Xanthomonas citri pv. malvacearum]ASN02273.1 hypothetical protein APY29_16070 [Xanthomonas citri pv. malvacearum]ASN08630.1 hypothetical protein APY30_06085 [Xanthomonas citri pv. malvacearum]
MSLLDRRKKHPSLLAFCGGLLAAIAVGLSAYASHGVADAVMQSRLLVASLYAFGHGAVLTVLGATETRALGRAGLYLLLLGTLLFAGSLVGGALLQWPTTLAPVGGVGLMLGWVVLAIGALRR